MRTQLLVATAAASLLLGAPAQAQSGVPNGQEFVTYCSNNANLVECHAFASGALGALVSMEALCGDPADERLALDIVMNGLLQMSPENRASINMNDAVTLSLIAQLPLCSEASF